MISSHAFVDKPLNLPFWAFAHGRSNFYFYGETFYRNLLWYSQIWIQIRINTVLPQVFFESRDSKSYIMPSFSQWCEGNWQVFFLVAVRFCSHKTQLMITAASGGVWRFPIRVLATEPEVDDVITIESVGLNKESVVGFRMNSQMRWVYGAWSDHVINAKSAAFSVSQFL